MGQNANGLPAMPELTGGGFLDDVGQFLWLHLIEVLATTLSSSKVLITVSVMRPCVSSEPPTIAN